MLVDDQQNILEPMLDQMRDRMYDSQRQDVFYRNERGDLAWTRKVWKFIKQIENNYNHHFLGYSSLRTVVAYLCWSQVP